MMVGARKSWKTKGGKRYGKMKNPSKKKIGILINILRTRAPFPVKGPPLAGSLRFPARTPQKGTPVLQNRPPGV